MNNEYKHRRTGDLDQTSQFVKYFRDFWPYPLKDKIKAALRTRHFCLVTNRIFIENINRLALLNCMERNEFIVQVLSDKMIEALQDPMLYKHIPNY